MRRGGAGRAWIVLVLYIFLIIIINDSYLSIIVIGVNSGIG